MRLNPLSAIQDINPYPCYASITEHTPLYFDEELNLWVAADAKSINEVITCKQMQVRPLRQQIHPELNNTAAGDVFRQLIRMREGEYQQQMKSLIASALSAQNLDHVFALSKELTKKQLDQNNDINGLLFSVPIGVLSLLCGFVPKDIPGLITLIADFVLCIPATVSTSQQQQASRAAKKLLDIFEFEINQAKNGMLLTTLLQLATEEGLQNNLSLIANSIGLFSQTYEATAGLIGNCLLNISQQPEALVFNDLDSYVEEVSRFDPPIQNTRRFAVESFNFQGHDIKQDETILLLIAAANRDPAVNHQPHDFILNRKQASNFTFGYGHHKCPGADLAKAISCGVIDSLYEYQSNYLITYHQEMRAFPC